MAGPLVATKLYVPTLRPGSIRRPRLSDRLVPSAGSRLALVSAPAGFGKSTLLAEWLGDARASGRRMAWLSLDAADNEPKAFWSHIVASLAQATGTGRALLARLDAGEPPDDAFIAALVNELGALPDAVDIVLDDYHVIALPQIHAAVSYLLDHLPPNARLVIATRADPPLPLARLRAQGELVEIRAADLRFSADEAATYLNGTMRLGLTDANVADLGGRTEGWIAALQLAALSLHGRGDAADFIATFTGNDRYVFDYLVEEVLQRQTPDLRRFLLRTSVLDRLSGRLCDAVLETSGSGAVLEAVHRGNLFLVPLDDRRRWYRYHHLFAEVLQAHLAEEAAGERLLLHRRASAWYEKEGEPAVAIRHALAGEDFDRAATLIVRAIPEFRRNRREVVLRDWLLALPDQLVRSQAVLGVALVGTRLQNGEFQDFDDRLDDAERALAAINLGHAGQPAAGLEAAREIQRLPAQIALYRAAMSQIRGDIPAMIEQAQTASDQAAADDPLGQASAAGLLGIAYWTIGELERAHQAWSDCVRGLEKAGHVSDALGATVAIADIARTRGRLGVAVTACERVLALAAGRDGPVPRGVADIHAALADLHRERGDLVLAREQLARSRELGERAGLGPYRYRWSVAMAGLLRAEGDMAGALEHLVEAERSYASDFFPNVRPVAALTARLRMEEGRLDEAARWQRGSGVGIDDDLGFMREFEHITLARLLLAEGAAARSARASDALGRFLVRLEDAAGKGERVGSVIEIKVLQALAHAARNGLGAALAALEEGLRLAEPERYVRLFVDFGEPVAALLRTALARGVMERYVRELLAAFVAPAPVGQRRPDDGVEPLSERELEVLQLLRSDLDGPAIARELMVSLNTMRTHTKNIYEKLGVSSRRAAVRRADELNLLRHRAPH